MRMRTATAVGALAAVTTGVAVWLSGADSVASGHPTAGPVPMPAAGPGSRSAQRPAAETSHAQVPAAGSKTSHAQGPAARSLQALVPHEKVSAYVPLSGGAEAATWGPKDNIEFWRWTASGSWQVVGRSATPEPVIDSLRGETKVVGAVLRGASDATFIVSGEFSVDGGANYVAYGAGSTGWGILRQTSATVMRAAGRPTEGLTGEAGPSLTFANGELVDTMTNTYFNHSQGMLYPLRTTWKWQGDGLVLDTSNAFVGQSVSAPLGGAPLPSTCPTSVPPAGRYRGWLVAQPATDGTVHLVVGATKSDVSGDVCKFSISPETPLSVQARSAGSSDPTWVTAPAWLLAADMHTFGPAATVGPQGVGYDSSPWIVPAGTGTLTVLSPLGVPLPFQGGDGNGTPVEGSISVANGAVTALSIAPIGG